ncbi:MAG: hypothetical protein ABIZ04_18090 [Opitutus sp.]
MRPTFVTCLVRELGHDHTVGGLLKKIFLRPFAAPSFAGFWRRWNPAYRYILLFYFYAPLRRLLPRWMAKWFTFVLCGLLLHDLPFLHGWQWLHGCRGFPEGALLFGIFGLGSWLSEAAPLDLSRCSAGLRVYANVACLILCFAVYIGLCALFSKSA